MAYIVIVTYLPAWSRENSDFFKLFDIDTDTVYRLSVQPVKLNAIGLLRLLPDALPDGFVLAQRRGLTPRETEILELLAAGRTLAVIKDKLVISPNTVRYHTKNIYSKLGVHAQQELIDMVEAVQR